MSVQLMGILNVTPDSFSDGGEFFDPQRAIARALEMTTEGAALIDIGAESTRPGSISIPQDEQLRRLLPVVKKLRERGIKLSIDTQSAAVAEACLKEGAAMLNDVSALRSDPAMSGVLAKSNCEIVLMHMQGTPATMQSNPRYENVVAEIMTFFKERIAACAAAGIATERLWLDPGIGFGKTAAHNWEIVRRFNEFASLGRPLLGALSRKSFLLQSAERHARDAASIAAGLALSARGASILRVHDVAGHAAALKVFDALNAK